MASPDGENFHSLLRSREWFQRAQTLPCGFDLPIRRRSGRWLDAVPPVGLARLIADQAGAPPAATGAGPLMRFSVEHASDLMGPTNAETHEAEEILQKVIASRASIYIRYSVWVVPLVFSSDAPNPALGHSSDRVAF